jgi:hypothetical protein
LRVDLAAANSFSISLAVKCSLRLGFLALDFGEIGIPSPTTKISFGLMFSARVLFKVTAT